MRASGLLLEWENITWEKKSSPKAPYFKKQGLKLSKATSLFDEWRQTWRSPFIRERERKSLKTKRLCLRREPGFLMSAAELPKARRLLRLSLAVSSESGEVVNKNKIKTAKKGYFLSDGRLLANSAVPPADHQSRLKWNTRKRATKFSPKKKKSIPAVEKPSTRIPAASEATTHTPTTFQRLFLFSALRLCLVSVPTAVTHSFPRVEIYHVWSHTRSRREVPLCPTNSQTAPPPPNSAAAGPAPARKRPLRVLHGKCSQPLPSSAVGKTSHFLRIILKLQNTTVLENVSPSFT